MSYRLHSHTKHIVEYGDGCFNWNCGTINKLLFFLCEDYCGNSDDFNSDSEIEIREYYFRKMLNDYDKNHQTIVDKINKEGLRLPTEHTIDDVMIKFRNLYESSDKSDGYIHLSWF